MTRGAGSYTNDANGTTPTGGGRTNTWDGQNRLTQCVDGGNTTTHTYGSDGLRRRTVQGTNTTDYVLDQQSVVRTLLNNSVDKTYLHGLRGPEYERIGSNDPKWYLYDGLGSVLGTVDENGTVVSTRKYDVYGAVRGSTGPGGTKHKFVGQLGHPSEDETGLVYMRARYYDPVTGRFASEDPRCYGVNWYVYASDSPVNQVDANGCQPVPLDQRVAYGIGCAFAAAALALAYWSMQSTATGPNKLGEITASKRAKICATVATGAFMYSLEGMATNDIEKYIGLATLSAELIGTVLDASAVATKVNYPGVALFVGATFTYGLMVTAAVLMTNPDWAL